MRASPLRHAASSLAHAGARADSGPRLLASSGPLADVLDFFISKALAIAPPGLKEYGGRLRCLRAASLCGLCKTEGFQLVLVGAKRAAELQERFQAAAIRADREEEVARQREIEAGRAIAAHPVVHAPAYQPEHPNPKRRNIDKFSRNIGNCTSYYDGWYPSFLQ